MTNLLNIILDFFGICPISYRIELSCLYVPQEHYFIRTFCLWSTDEYVKFGILSESPPLIIESIKRTSTSSTSYTVYNTKHKPQSMLMFTRKLVSMHYFNWNGTVIPLKQQVIYTINREIHMCVHELTLLWRQ